VDDKLRKAEREEKLTPAHLRRAGLKGPFEVANMRFGFATNSSSSHSVVLLPGVGDQVADYEDGLSYGWGNFTLASREAKAAYLAIGIRDHYNRNEKFGKLELTALVRAVLGDLIAHVSDEELFEGYIDHQSSPGFPNPLRHGDGMTPLWDLLKEAIIDNPDVVILGGNDNGDGHPLRDSAHDFSLYDDVVWQEDYRSTRVFLKDLNHITIFDKLTGTRVRVVKTGDPKPEFSTHPELVDLKITDYCGMGCDYCYQDSTKDGKHADANFVRQLAYSLTGRTFEVAIGGGEPTDHPNFASILGNFSAYNITPSFSTQSWTWFKDAEILNAVKKHAGAVALSTQKPEHVVPWFQQCKDHEIRGHIHYVLGLSPLENLAKLMQELHERDDYLRGHLVLLAFKSVGRGKQVAPYDYTGWGDIVRENQKYRWTVAVDSFLVADVPTELAETNPVLYENTDGKFSMYIDAVDKLCGAHSFLDKSDMFQLENAYQVDKAWARIKQAASAEG
jgi:hypothetical protein